MWPGPIYKKSLTALLLLILLVCCYLPLGGCDSTSAERVDRLKLLVDRSLQQSAQLDASIDKLQTVIEEQKTVLVDPNTSDSHAGDIAAFLAKASEMLGKAQEKKHTVEQQMAKWQGQIEQIQATGSINVGDELDLYGQGITGGSQALPPPYNLYGMLLGTVLSAVGGAYGVAKRKQAQEAKNDATKSDSVAYDIVKSVDVLLGQMEEGEVSASQAKTILRAEQDRQTRQAVRAVNGETT